MGDVTKKFLKNYRKLKGGARKARFLHSKIDDAVKSFISSMKHPQIIQCKKGCSACCHTQVSVTKEEADHLADLVQRGVKIDLDKLERQVMAKSNFYQLSYQDRACVFLEQGECRIYENRPAVCRANFSLSDPVFCETRDGQERSQRMLMIESAHLLMAAAFLDSQKVGALPEMLNEALSSSKARARSVVLR